MSQAGRSVRLKTLSKIVLQEPHYIRCIKPNDAKSPVLFDQKLVEHQVRMIRKLSDVDLI